MRNVQQGCCESAVMNLGYAQIRSMIKIRPPRPTCIWAENLPRQTSGQSLHNVTFKFGFEKELVNIFIVICPFLAHFFFFYINFVSKADHFGRTPSIWNRERRRRGRGNCHWFACMSIDAHAIEAALEFQFFPDSSEVVEMQVLNWKGSWNLEKNTW